MNIPGNNVPIIGGHKEPVVLNAQIIITPQLQRKLAQWQAETGVSLITFGNVVLTLGIAQLSKLIDNDKSTLNAEIERIETEPENWPAKDS